MKHLLIIILLALNVSNIQAQSKEFELYDNGLIYNGETITKLQYIVDSLNLQFKSCGNEKTFYSLEQGPGNIIELKGKNAEPAHLDLTNGMGLKDFISKYPEAKITQNTYIIKVKYIEDSNLWNDIFEFKFDSYGGLSINISENTLKKLPNPNWILDYKSYDRNIVRGVFLGKPLESRSLPHKYADMIGYAECLIDSNANKYNEDAKIEWIDIPTEYSHLCFNEKEELLSKMRSTRVVGDCSMDFRPREHAMSIAILSAETYRWEIFLKAHLDIMNDYFHRLSDGSHARIHRNTYVKELEELNIDVQSLLFGILFRSQNISDNHYLGSPSRIGRALSESGEAENVENSILSIIQDEELDIYNRLIFYYMFQSYNYYTEEGLSKKKNEARLRKAAKTFPNYIHTRLLE